MAHVVCLIADPERTPLDGALVAALERALGATARWLADGRSLRAAGRRSATAVRSARAPRRRWATAL